MKISSILAHEDCDSELQKKIKVAIADIKCRHAKYIQHGKFFVCSTGCNKKINVGVNGNCPWGGNQEVDWEAAKEECGCYK